MNTTTQYATTGTLLTDLYGSDYEPSEEGLETVGDDILDTFYNGNFSAGINEMIKLDIRPPELFEYVQDKLDEHGTGYYGWFDIGLACEVTQTYYNNYKSRPI